MSDGARARWMAAVDAREHLWPSDEQRLLLDAALFDGDRATNAFRAWRSTVQLEAEFSRGSYRLLPLVYHNMLQLGMRDPLMGRLKGVYRRSWYETHQLFHRTQPLVKQLADAGIDVMLLKGAPLALSYYGNVALRPMADLDISVPQHRLADALGIMRRLGWRFSADPDAEMVRFRHAVQCFGPDGSEVDLHWRVMYEIPEDAGDAEFWTTSEALDFMGTAVRQPDPTHTLLLIVVHGIRWNIETPVRWIPDALAVLRTRAADIDWGRLLALATQYRVTYRLGLGLTYRAETRSAAIPADTLGRIDAAGLTMLERFENSVLLHDDGSLNISLARTQLGF
ncbi:MAG TPA: nucleotidyltransferase family protein, partial [Gemmatimonadaceae bacterium]|nr:nucleotidyltransferase family protein [Gemmatimonadaceae bacterium]